MIDGNGRKIDHLRLSVTSRCNLECFYCHREGNGLCTAEMELGRVFQILQEFRRAGMVGLKITGGEPLLREDIPDIIAEAARLGYDFGLTTNGTLLEGFALRLKASGLRRINIGCDSLTGVLPKNTERLRAGIIAAVRAGLEVKLNMVALRGINDMQIMPMLDFCIRNRVNLQLIELAEQAAWQRKYFLALEQWESLLAGMAEKKEIRVMQNRPRYYLRGIFVELVRPGKDFCRACNKIRVTADGRVRACLAKDECIKFQGRSSIEKVIRVKEYGYDL